MIRLLIRLSLLGIVAGGIAGCRDAKVTAYRIPKEPVPVEATPDPMTGAVAVVTGADLTWSAPAGWTAKPATATRKGSYQVGADGDLSITVFGGAAGGELLNINRWRGQVQLEPVTEAGLSGVIARSEHDGLKFAVVDFAGGGQRILGAIVPAGADTWFFKLAGPDAPIAAAKASFLEFLQTVKPSGK